MKVTVECSRCGDKFSNDDPLFEERKKRHVEGRHTEHHVISERDGSLIHGHGMGNLDIGQVTWITVW